MRFDSVPNWWGYFPAQNKKIFKTKRFTFINHSNFVLFQPSPHKLCDHKLTFVLAKRSTPRHDTANVELKQITQPLQPLQPSCYVDLMTWKSKQANDQRMTSQKLTLIKHEHTIIIKFVSSMSNHIHNYDCCCCIYMKNSLTISQLRRQSCKIVLYLRNNMRLLHKMSIYLI